MSVMSGPSAVLKPRASNLSSPQPMNLPAPVSKVHPPEDAPRASDGSSSSEGGDGDEAEVPSHANVRPIKVSEASDVPSRTPPRKGETDAGQLRICAVTWNMCGRRFPDNLEPMLAPLFGGEGERRGWTAAGDAEGTPCDVLVVGVQEAPAMDGFVERLMDALGGEDEFEHLAGVSLEPGGWIQMEVFVRRELLPMVKDVRRDAVSCGIGNVIGNKGGVGVSFEYAGARLCFLNAHLAAHTEKVKQRNADYHRIVKTLFAPRGGSGGGESKKAKTGKNAVAPAPAGEDGDDDTVSTIDPTRPTPETPSMLGGLIKRKGWSAADGFDLCVFVGDLNYRVEGNRRAVDVLLDRGMFDVMRANDQLAIERDAGRVFAGWSEGDLSFPPTYKFNRGTNDTYDSSKKQRVPSWTDRVLWRTADGGRVSCAPSPDVYTSATGILTSDHLPVVARIEASVEGARNAIPHVGGSPYAGSKSRHVFSVC